MIIEKILNKINKSRLSTDPFPHFVIKNLISKKKLSLLNKVLPNFYDIKSEDIYFQSKSKTKKTLLPSSKQYKKLIKNKHFKEVNAIFRKIKPVVIKKFNSEILKYVKKQYQNSKLKFHSTYNVMNSGYKKSVHLDRRDHLVHILYYPKAEKSKGGDIQLYSLKNKKKMFDIFPDTFDLQLKKKYKIKNNFCLFTLNVPWSYHGVTNYYGKNRKYFYAVYDFISKSDGIRLKNRLKGNNDNNYWKQKVTVYSKKRKNIFFTE